MSFIAARRHESGALEYQLWQNYSFGTQVADNGVNLCCYPTIKAPARYRRRF